VIIVITFIFDVKLGIKVYAICHSSQTYKIEESLGPGPSLPPAPTTVADKTGVLVSGTDGSIKSSIASALQQSDFARFETYPPHESSYWKNSVRSDSPLPKIHSNHKNRSDFSKCPSIHIEDSESFFVAMF